LDWSLKNVFIVGKVIVSEMLENIHRVPRPDEQTHVLTIFLMNKATLMKYAKPILKTHCKSVVGKL